MRRTADGQEDITAERDEAVARVQRETAAGVGLRTSQTSTSEVDALRSDLSVSLRSGSSRTDIAVLERRRTWRILKLTWKSS